jgi:hypothetical protein
MGSVRSEIFIGTQPVRGASRARNFIPQARDENEIIAKFLESALPGRVLEVNRQIPNTTHFPEDSIVEVFSAALPTTTTLGQFLETSRRQTQAEKDIRRAEAQSQLNHIRRPLSLRRFSFLLPTILG